MSPSEVTLVVVGAAFALFLAIRMVPLRRRADGPELRAARARVAAATSPRARAEALLEVARLARARGSATKAASYVSRALRADPGWLEGVAEAAQVLRGRPALLERVLLRRLEGLSLEGEGRAAARAAFAALAGAYGRRPLERARARLYAKLAGAL